MLGLPLLLSLPFALSAAVPALRHALPNPISRTDYRIPSIHESAILARRMLNISTIGTLSTVFPSTRAASFTDEPTIQASFGLDTEADNALSAIPNDIAGSPIGLMEYYATCPPHPYNPTILAVSIATYIRNAHSGSNVSLSIRWQPPASAPPSSDPYLYSPANLPRFSLQGYIEAIPAHEIQQYGTKECFLSRHEEVIWTPGNDIHESWWGRIIVQGVYWFGGFGDRARIGWIPIEEWRGVSEWEISKARLPGEEGYRPPMMLTDRSNMGSATDL